MRSQAHIHNTCTYTLARVRAYTHTHTHTQTHTLLPPPRTDEYTHHTHAYIRTHAYTHAYTHTLARAACLQLKLHHLDAVELPSLDNLPKDLHDKLEVLGVATLKGRWRMAMQVHSPCVWCCALRSALETG